MASFAVHNSAPHVDDLARVGVQSVDKALPKLRKTSWSLKHKHFDLQPEEIVLYETFDDTIKTRVVNKSETTGLNPCQAIYSNGKWVVVGVTAEACELEYPQTQGSGMVNAILKNGKWLESTDEAKRTQLFTKLDTKDADLDDFMVTSYDNEHNLTACTRSSHRQSDDGF